MMMMSGILVVILMEVEVTLVMLVMEGVVVMMKMGVAALMMMVETVIMATKVRRMSGRSRNIEVG